MFRWLEIGQWRPFLADDCPDSLRLRRQSQFAIKMWREPYSRYAGFLKLPSKLLSEWVGQKARIDEDGFNARVLFGRASNVANTFDQIKAGTGPALRSLEEAQSDEAGITILAN
jgi:hypothetical protein